MKIRLRHAAAGLAQGISLPHIGIRTVLDPGFFLGTITHSACLCASGVVCPASPFLAMACAAGGNPRSLPRLAQ
ncbi:Hypothetical protein GbCGDNIH7_8296 [Granulibacter bethesdensis]|nr:Hypothetical protein GbCGDNIH7_8296 [Granulibacter bethesdensis]